MEQSWECNDSQPHRAKFERGGLDPHGYFWREVLSAVSAKKHVSTPGSPSSARVRLVPRSSGSTKELGTLEWNTYAVVVHLGCTPKSRLDCHCAPLQQRASAPNHPSTLLAPLLLFAGRVEEVPHTVRGTVSAGGANPHRDTGVRSPAAPNTRFPIRIVQPRQAQKITIF